MTYLGMSLRSRDTVEQQSCDIRFYLFTLQFKYCTCIFTIVLQYAERNFVVTLIFFIVIFCILKQDIVCFQIFISVFNCLYA